MVTVRRATTDDVDAVRAVGHATWPSTYGPLFGDDYVAHGLATWWSPEVVERGIVELRTFVAENGTGDVVGCSVVGEQADGWFVYKLYVRPEHQGAGAGRALLDAVVADLPTDATSVRLGHADGNDRAHAFYERHGFVETHRQGEGVDREVRMERRLR